MFYRFQFPLKHWQRNFAQKKRAFGNKKSCYKGMIKDRDSSAWKHSIFTRAISFFSLPSLPPVVFFYFLRFLCLHTRRNFYAYQIKNRIKWTLHRLACVTKRLFDFPTWKCVECLHLIRIFTLAIISDSSKCFTLDICFEVPLVSQSLFLNSSNGYVQFSTVYVIIARSKLSSPFEFISVYSK